MPVGSTPCCVHRALSAPAFIVSRSCMVNFCGSAAAPPVATPAASSAALLLLRLLVTLLLSLLLVLHRRRRLLRRPPSSLLFSRFLLLLAPRPFRWPPALLASSPALPRARLSLLLGLALRSQSPA